MAPSLVSAVTGTAVLAARVLATDKVYKLQETYEGKGFFEKFDFYQSIISDKPNRYDIDPTAGFVNYTTKDYAMTNGLATWTSSGLPYIGVDSKKAISDKGPFGRESVRLESKKVYGKGLYVFDIAHLPKAVDGSWPAIWMYADWANNGEKWAQSGDIDILEGWNANQVGNRQTLHSAAGCSVVDTDMRAKMDSFNCDYTFNETFHGLRQYQYQGCSSTDAEGPFGDTNGGVFVVEWTGDFIKMWSFQQSDTDHLKVLQSENPDTSALGRPTFSTAGGDGACDIESHFAEKQKIVINLDFCGVAGDDGYWPYTETGKTGVSCWDWVASNPTAFGEVYFTVNSIKVYQAVEGSTSSSSASASVSTPAGTQTVGTTGSVTNTGTASPTGSNTDGSDESSYTTSSYSSSDADGEDDDYCDEEEGDDDSSYAATNSSSPYAAGSSSSYATGSSSPYGTGDQSGDDYKASTTGAASSYATAAPNSEDEEDYPITTTTPISYTTSTQYITNYYTITSCAPSITNCPVGNVTSEVYATVTVCPVTEAYSATAQVTGSGSPSYAQPESQPQYTAVPDKSDEDSYGSVSPSSAASPAASQPAGAPYYDDDDDESDSVSHTHDYSHSTADVTVVATTAIVTPVPPASYVPHANGTHPATTAATSNGAVTGYASPSGSYSAKPSASVIAASGAESTARVGAVGLLVAAGAAVLLM